MKTILIILFISSLSFAQLFSPYKTKAETDAYKQGCIDGVDIAIKTYNETLSLYAISVDINKKLLIKLIEEYKKDCIVEWRLYILIKDKVWIEPIRKDWKKCLEKEPTLKGFEIWLKKHLDNDQNN